MIKALKKEFKNFLRQMLTNICDSRCIQCSDAEIRSYSKKELKELINKYNFKLYNFGFDIIYPNLTTNLHQKY